ncbi:MAG: glutamate 5-kinase [Syntrophobacteraceae bacterium]|nr:glutamate 5-kinase [Syntrophobacteraceae bacterium]
MRESVKRTELFSRCRRVLVKVGSATVTGSKGLDRAMIHRLSDQIAELRRRTPRIDILVVSSGAIASGMYRMGLAERPRSIPHKQAVAAVGQGALMEAWEGAFDKYDLLVAQVLLTSEDLANRRRYLNARNTLETLLSWGITPIINENDTVVVEEIKFGDNDNLSALIAGLVGADLVINLTDTEGLYDCNPRRDPTARLIPVVHRVDRTILACAAPEPGAVGTGGMLSKVNAARKCLALGIPMIIAPGKHRDILLRLFEGEELGTMFVPRNRAWSGKKVWLANLPKPSGEITLDDGAAAALIERGRSLLPIGIREVRGVFGVGAPVRCLDRSGNVIGIGLTNYKSTEIETIKGCHSDEIEGLIGYKHSDEVIHRDNFVLTGESAQEL